MGDDEVLKSFGTEKLEELTSVNIVGGGGDFRNMNIRFDNFE